VLSRISRRLFRAVLLRFVAFATFASTACLTLPSLAAQTDGKLPAFVGLPRPLPAACITADTPAAEQALAREIDGAARQFGVRPSFLRAVVACESNFKEHAQSKAGARGLAQIMPATATELGVHPDLLWIPRYNLYSSAKYIRYLSDRYGNNLDKVLIAYNAGPSYVEKPRPLPAETIQYVLRVKSAYRHFLARE